VYDVCRWIQLPCPPNFPGKAKQRLRILIVEDHTPTRHGMSRLIRQAGASVTPATGNELGYLLPSTLN